MNDYNQNNNNFNVGETNNVTTEPETYDSYYNHKQRKSYWPIIIIISFIIVVILVSLWFSGVFTPIDKQSEYTKLYTRVCKAAVSYATDKYGDEKYTTGKIVYVTVSELANANLVEAELTNYVTGEKIPVTTPIRLEVLPSGSFECHGFLLAGDDTTKPIIKLKGDTTIYSKVGETVTDPGYTATDNTDGDITDKVERSGTVNINIAGTYKITYVVADRSENSSDAVTRTYIVQ